VQTGIVILCASFFYFLFRGSPEKEDDADSHSFILCNPNNPCCIDSLDDSLSSVMKQTSRVGSVTVFHSCEDRSFASDRFKMKMKDLESMEKNMETQHNKISQTFMHEQICTKENMLVCVLERIESLKKLEKQPSNIFIQLSSHILDPIAHEHLLLYMDSRPELSAVRPLAHPPKTLEAAEQISLTLQLSMCKTCINPVPLVLKTEKFASLAAEFSEEGLLKDRKDANSIAKMLILKALSNSRIVRSPLFTNENTETCGELCISYEDIAITPETEKYIVDKSYILSDPDFYAWSSRLENTERYESVKGDSKFSPVVDTGKVDHLLDEPIYRRQSNNSIMFLVPSIQMGGSEKSVFDIAQSAKDMGWDISIILTMPEFEIDDLGEIVLKNEWINKAREITPDVFEILGIAQNNKFVKYLRYFLESRQPNYIFTANSVSIYEHLEFIRKVLPAAFIADYNHMIHPSWKFRDEIGAGGLPRIGSFYSQYIDMHFTSSKFVSRAMEGWIDPAIMEKAPTKVKTCYIGTDPSFAFSGEALVNERSKWRKEHGIGDEKQVILFAGRYVRQKGVDVLCKVLREISKDEQASKTMSFVFMGSGPQEAYLQATIDSLKHTSSLQVITHNPTTDSESIHTVYSMADILFLPSRNEGIALVVYEAMASGLLVVTTDVGGHSEIIDDTTGVLLPSLDSVENPTVYLSDKLKDITTNFNDYTSIRENGKTRIANKYTSKEFMSCILDTMTESANKLQVGKVTPPREAEIEEMSYNANLLRTTQEQRADGINKINLLKRPIESIVTIGIKTYICDESVIRQIQRFIRSIRTNYETVRIILGNDGPLQTSGLNFMREDDHVEEIMLQHDAGISAGRNIMASMAKTEYFVLMDDDHVFDADTSLEKAIEGITKHEFDIVGFRVYNLPGVQDLETSSVRIPTYVSFLSGIKNRNLTVCQWNENNGPSVVKMNAPIKVDVIHNAFIARTSTLIKHPWRSTLKVNEHMTFFLDAKKGNVKVGYLPSVYVHHRRRTYTQCYWNARFREDKYQAQLDYDAGFTHDSECENGFPQRVQEHIEKNHDRDDMRFQITRHF